MDMYVPVKFCLCQLNSACCTVSTNLRENPTSSRYVSCKYAPLHATRKVTHGCSRVSSGTNLNWYCMASIGQRATLPTPVMQGVLLGGASHQITLRITQGFCGTTYSLDAFDVVLDNGPVKVESLNMSLIKYTQPIILAARCFMVPSWCPPISQSNHTRKITGGLQCALAST